MKFTRVIKCNMLTRRHDRGRNKDTSSPKKHHAYYGDRANQVQLKPETYLEWAIALNNHLTGSNIEVHTTHSIELNVGIDTFLSWHVARCLSFFRP